MRKVVIRGGEPEKDDSGRRSWLLANSAEVRTSSAGGAKRPPKARFLEPYRLSSDRRSALLECLRAAGVGDPESRDLFATAVEYDIASFRQSRGEADPGPDSQPICEQAADPIADDAVLPTPVLVAPERAADPAASGGRRAGALASEPLPALLSVADAARTLAASILALAPVDRAALAAALQVADPFRRGYDGAYLDALTAELERIGGIPASAPPSAAEVEEPLDRPTEASVAISGKPLEAPLGEAAQHFVRRVARVYEQCLEVSPSVDPESTFLVVLRVLAPEAGVGLPASAEVFAQSLKDL